MIYFCIPAHNEERTVGVVLWKLRQVMAELDRDYQIIVVDDASSDSSPAVLNPYIRVLPLTVFRNAERRGYAASLEIAVREAVRRAPYPKRDTVITLQADFTEDPDVVTALVKRIEAGADVVATDVQLEESAPRNVRWGRRFFRWLLRKHEWAAIGDPLSGLRAYRIMVLKRALDARGSARLLSWNGVAANAELLAQATPHSRRNEVVETTVLSHRLQRPSRFDFMTAWREIRGVASGRISATAQPLPTENIVVVSEPVLIEAPPSGRARPDGAGRRRQSGERGQTRQRREQFGPPREKTAARKPAKTAAVKAAAAPARGATPAKDATPANDGATAPAARPDGVETQPRKRRRARRRKSKTAPQAPKLVGENPESAAATPPESPAPDAGDGTEAAPAKKKSRRGRRGGRGRRKGPRANEPDKETNGDAGEIPPPLAAEGD